MRRKGRSFWQLNLLTSLYVELPGAHWGPSYITLSALLFTYIYFAVQGGWEKIVMRRICNDELLSATEERDLGIETKGGSAREIDLWVSGVYSPPHFTTQPTYFIYGIDHLNVLGKFWSG